MNHTQIKRLAANYLLILTLIGLCRTFLRDVVIQSMNETKKKHMKCYPLEFSLIGNKFPRRMTNITESTCLSQYLDQELIGYLFDVRRCFMIKSKLNNDKL